MSLAIITELLHCWLVCISVHGSLLPTLWFVTTFRCFPTTNHWSPLFTSNQSLMIIVFNRQSLITTVSIPLLSRLYLQVIKVSYLFCNPFLCLSFWLHTTTAAFCLWSNMIEICWFLSRINVIFLSLHSDRALFYSKIVYSLWITPLFKSTPFSSVLFL